MQRTVLEPNTATDRLIRQLLVSLLEEIPEVAVALVSPLDPADWPAPQTYYRVTKAARLQNRPARLTRFVPTVSDWKALSPLLRVGQCHRICADDRMANPALNRAVKASWGIAACPVATPTGGLKGAVFVIVDEQPAPRKNQHLQFAIVRVSRQIAAVLELREQVGAPMPCVAAA